MARRYNLTRLDSNKVIFGLMNRKIFELVIWINDPSIEWGRFKERGEEKCRKQRTNQVKRGANRVYKYPAEPVTAGWKKITLIKEIFKGYLRRTKC